MHEAHKYAQPTAIVVQRELAANLSSNKNLGYRIDFYSGDTTLIDNERFVSAVYNGTDGDHWVLLQESDECVASVLGVAHSQNDAHRRVKKMALDLGKLVADERKLEFRDWTEKVRLPTQPSPK